MNLIALISVLVIIIFPAYSIYFSQSSNSPLYRQIALWAVVLSRPVVSQYPVVHCAIKKLAEHLVQLQLTVEFHNVVGKSFLLKEVPQMITCEHQSPHELMQANALAARRMPIVLNQPSISCSVFCSSHSPKLR